MTSSDFPSPLRSPVRATELLDRRLAVKDQNLAQGARSIVYVDRRPPRVSEPSGIREGSAGDQLLHAVAVQVARGSHREAELVRGRCTVDVRELQTLIARVEVRVTEIVA
jgi:hypothetical protein